MKSNKYISLMCLISLSLGNSAWSQAPGGRGGPGQHGPAQGPGQPGGPGAGPRGDGWAGQGGHPFNGPNPGIGRINQPVFSTGCGQQYSQPAQSALLTACVAGGQAAMQVAQRLATQEGRNDGFRTGYAWGLRSGIDSTRSDANQIAAGQAALNAGTSPNAIADLANADQAGANAGQSQGNPSGNQEAISRFHAAIDTGAMPSQTVGSADYAKYNPQYSSPYSNAYAQTVSAIPTEQSMVNSLSNPVNNARIDPGQVTFYGNGYDQGLMGNAPPFRPGDFYSPDGSYRFNRNQAMDANQAFNTFTGRGGFDDSVYNTLGSVQIITGYTTPPPAPPAPVAGPIPGPIAAVAAAAPADPAPKTPPTGPGAPGAGHPGTPPTTPVSPGKPVGPVTPPTTPVAPVTPPAAPVTPVAPPTPVAPATPTPTPFVPQPIYTTYNLKQVFETSFMQSYNEVAGYYYNDAFNNILDDGTNAGYYVGQQVGEQLAYNAGLVSAYNSQFSLREGNAFVLAYDNAFNTAFTSEYQVYATSPQIGVDSFSIVGSHNDGIVEPGEQITGSYTVRNYGGVDATLPVTIQGDVTGAQQTTLVVPKLSTSVQKGSVSATMSSSLPSQSEASVILNVGGNQVPLRQYVTNQIVASPGSYTPDMPHGNVSVTLPLQNVSTGNSYDAISILVSDSYNRSEIITVGFLAGGQTWSAPININGYSPLDLIDGKISVKMQAMLGSVVVGAANLQIQPNDTPNHLIAQTFEAAVIAANASLQAQLTSRIYSVINSEALAEGRGDYQGDSKTLISAIVNFKKSHPQTTATLAAYKSLATTLQPVVKAIHNQHGGLFGSGTENEHYFTAQLQILNSN